MGRGWIMGGVLAVALVALVVAGTVAFVDGDDASSARHTDGAFIAEMIPHHSSAIEMAAVALSEAEREEVRELAGEIARSQREEIRRLRAIHRRLFGDQPPDSPVLDHGTLGLSAEEMGTDHDARMLLEADPFDRAFIDMMIPHHQGAIRMARVLLERGEDPELRELAEEIVHEQSHEIERMNAWREEWYGDPSPSGGVPAEGEAPSHDEMDH